ncbi:MAG TPA: beta-N-acetylhexosaminidase, partial [Pyrinomonadaceae bacterium]|nr:beta-N-acetylhexosaminidase [Pyrinomonadaceae bacterium]
MKFQILALICTYVFASVSFAQVSEINIIPKPRSVQNKAGAFTLNKNTKLSALGGAAARDNAVVFNDMLDQLYGFRLKIVGEKTTKNVIVLRYGEALGKETYNLQVDPDSIQLVGSDPAGMFYALQSFSQLLPIGTRKTIQIPAVSIEDGPRFPYRGIHLDVGRHFMPVSFVKKYIDLMAQYKFNYFHWHLTEDQGWRIEIKKYPKLTEIGSKRPETVLGRNLQPYVGDKTPVEGFYTQDEIRDVIAYAKARYITIIPEIELPGHSSAALAAYPEFGCKADYQYKVQTTWGIFKEVYCPTEKTFKFLEDVLSEVIDLFPDSPYIHIGGDEVLKDMWKESPEVQQLMARENLKDVNEVQSYFVRRMEKFINSKGKKIIGWDEILEGGL